MALIKCPDCGKEFSDSAVACPNCGRPHKQVQPVEIRKKPGCLAIGCLSMLAIAVIGGVINQSTHPIAATADPAVAPFVTKSAPGGVPAVVDRWQVTHEQSKMDDSKTVILSLDADSPIKGWLDTETPTLFVRCREHKTDISIYTGMSSQPEYGEFERYTVRLRLDSGSAFSQMWSESTDSKAMFAPEPISLARRLAKAKRLRISFTPFNASSVTAEFTLAGLAKRLPEVAQTCGWQP